MRDDRGLYRTSFTLGSTIWETVWATSRPRALFERREIIVRDKLLMIFMSLLTLGVALFAIDAYRDKSELEEKLATYQSEEQLKRC